MTKPSEDPLFPITTMAMDYIIAVDGKHHANPLSMSDEEFKKTDHLLARIYNRLGMEGGHEAINKARKAYEIMNG